jgi:hypothetical protein
VLTCFASIYFSLLLDQKDSNIGFTQNFSAFLSYKISKLFRKSKENIIFISLAKGSNMKVK